MGGVVNNFVLGLDVSGLILSNRLDVSLPSVLRHLQEWSIQGSGTTALMMLESGSFLLLPQC